MPEPMPSNMPQNIPQHLHVAERWSTGARLIKRARSPAGPARAWGLVVGGAEMITVAPTVSE